MQLAKQGARWEGKKWQGKSLTSSIDATPLGPETPWYSELIMAIVWYLYIIEILWIENLIKWEEEEGPAPAEVFHAVALETLVRVVILLKQGQNWRRNSRRYTRDIGRIRGGGGRGRREEEGAEVARRVCEGEASERRTVRKDDAQTIAVQLR